LKEHSKLDTFFFLFFNFPAEKFSSHWFWLMMVACTHFMISLFPSVVTSIMIFRFLTEILTAVSKLIFCSIEFHRSYYFSSISFCMVPCFSAVPQGDGALLSRR